MLLDFAGLCRPYCLASSPHRRKTRAFPGTKAKIWRETDCLLEGDGFELLVRGRGQSGCRPCWVGCALRSGAVRARRFWYSAVSATGLGGLSRRPRGLSSRRRLSGRYRSSAGQDLYLGDGDQGNQRCASAIRRGRLFAQSTARTHGARCAHVHDRGDTAQILRTVVALNGATRG